MKARKLGLSFATLALALAAAEVAWRLRPTAGHGPTTNPRYVEHDPLLGWRYRPGARVRHASDEFDVEVAINELGFRQPSAPGPRPDVLVLGDSYAFGWGVEASEALAAKLGELSGLHVWNHAVSGTGTDQQLLILRHRADRLSPRAVVVVFCGNDLVEVMRPISYGRRKPRFELADGELRLVGSPVPQPFLERHSELFRSVLRIVRDRGQRPLPDADVPRARALVLALFAEMEIEARALGAELLVVHEGVAWLAEGLGDRALDVQPALAAAAASGPVRFERDGHWNARGHEVVARAIVPALPRE